MNIDLKRKEFKSEHTALQLFRLGTCGSVNPDVEVDNMLVSQNVVGFRWFNAFYQDYEFENDLPRNFMEKIPIQKKLSQCYFSEWTESQYDYFKDAKYVGKYCYFRVSMLHKEDNYV